MDVIDGKIGAEGQFDIKIEQGVVKFTAAHASKGAELGAFANVSVEYFLDKLKAAIPGPVDDVIIDVLKGAMKAV